MVYISVQVFMRLLAECNYKYTTRNYHMTSSHCTTQSFFSWWRKLWLPAPLHCCLCEAVVDTKERRRSRRSVATTINLLKDTVVDVAVFNRDSKLCRRRHRKLVATLDQSRSRWEDERAEEADRESWRACWRATVAASRSSVFLQANIQAFQVKKLLGGV